MYKITMAPHELPKEPSRPYGFIVSETESSCSIKHFRTGMRRMNLFLGCLLIAWVCVILFIVIPIYSPFEGLTLESGAFFIPLGVIPLILIYCLFTKKTFYLGETSLQVETQVLFLKWNLTLPRETVAHLIQIQDGGIGRDSFPSWGLKIKSASSNKTLASRILSYIHFRHNVRYRSLLFRLPYEHSLWLGIVLARWAHTKLDLCRRP